MSGREGRKEVRNCWGCWLVGERCEKYGKEAMLKDSGNTGNQVATEKGALDCTGVGVGELLAFRAWGQRGGHIEC